MTARNFFLSGAITGHEKEAAEYFAAAEKAVKDKYPLAAVYNPAKLSPTLSWEMAMTICVTRVRGWATDIVYIANNHYLTSVGAGREASLAKEHRLQEHLFVAGVLIEGGDVCSALAR